MTLTASGRRVWKAMRRLRRLGLEMLVALGLAVLVWLYTRSRDRDTLDQVAIPVQIQLGPAYAGQYDLEVHGSSRVITSFTGPPARLRELRRQLQRGQVRASFTLAVPEERQNDSSYRDGVRVEAAHIPVPPGVVAVLSEQGNTISYTVHRLVERQLAVRLEYVGDARISQIKLEPPAVVVRGPKEVLDRLWSIPTQAYPLTPSPDAPEGKEDVVRGQVALVAESDGQALQITPKKVTFSCRVRPRQKTYQLSDVPVHFLCPPNFPWRPKFAGSQAGKIAIHIRGPAGEEIPPVQAFVDLTVSNLGQGRNLLPVRLQLPRDFQAVSDNPPLVAFTLEPVEPTISEQDK